MRQLVVLLAVTLLIGGARADARSQQSDIVLGPVLGGNHVFWLEGDGSSDSIRRWSPGTSPQTVYRRRSRARGISELAASESRLAFRRTWETSANVVGDALAGPPQGP